MGSLPCQVEGCRAQVPLKKTLGIVERRSNTSVPSTAEERQGMSDFIDTDVLIIGGGPAGCACALYTARSALSTIILDKNPAVGALAITHKIANYPGVDANTSVQTCSKRCVSRP